MNFLRVIAGFAIFILGLYASWTVVVALGTGDIVQLSKHGDAIFHKVVEPNRYWVTIVFWIIASIMLIGGGINMMRKNL